MNTHRRRVLPAFIILTIFAIALGAPAPAQPQNAATSFNGASQLAIPFNQNWLFGGRFTEAALAPGFNDSSFGRVTLPHCVTRLSWQDWDAAKWQQVWIYRKHFTLPDAFKNQRVFIHFEGVMVGVTPVINGRRLPGHLGGYLPARYELTDFLAEGENVLAVEVDSRWSNTPPEGDTKKRTASIDYLEPGGIHRQAWLEAVPKVYISNVFAKPANVLDAAARRVDVICTLDAATGGNQGVITTELRDGARVVAKAARDIVVEKQGVSEHRLALAGLDGVRLWSPESPKLYNVVTTLKLAGQPAHEYTTRIGFREARFETDGFYLNGKRLVIFGLNRHELFPYAGMAMPPRVMRRDAEIIKRDLNCNFVRCSHYPQSDAFLDACDELGLLVWEEAPGWQYIGDDTWKKHFVRDVRDMIIRDRNRPSIVIWGTRANESRNDVELYKQTRDLAKLLDDTRPSSGSMDNRRNWERDWHEDVFAYDDYHAEKPGSVGIRPPVAGYSYFLSEAVGQFNYAAGKGFDSYYRRVGDIDKQQNQALFHAQAHGKAAGMANMGGVVAWCAFDYGSLINAYKNLKTPGVVDTFRIPKLGAAFYQSQCDASERVVIIPAFYWDFGPNTPRGPGKHAAIFSNCDRLEVYINNEKRATLEPDMKNYPNLKHAPFFVDLGLDGGAAVGKPELKIEGYIDGKLALTRQFSSDASQDKFIMAADDAEIAGDGSDATRVMFEVVDKYGAPRAFATGEVTFEIAGPGTLVGDNPFPLEPTGGVGAVWLRSAQGGSGQITLTARHSRLGPRQVRITVAPMK